MSSDKSLYLVTFSVVVYKQPVDEIERVVRSLLLYANKKVIYIIDNSPCMVVQNLCHLSKCIVLKHFPKNIGFGQAHNWAISEAKKKGSKYHFVVNPDIFYSKDVVLPMVEFMEHNQEVGEMMPKILYPNGKTQFLPKLMPSPLMLAQRKLSQFFPAVRSRWMKRFEMRQMADDKVYDIGHVSGSFAAFRMKALDDCGTFDSRFFLYFEDTDISRRIHKKYRTIYYPLVAVYHDYGNGASKSPKLFSIFIMSLIKFFNKWGWFFDDERKICNNKFLAQLQ